VTGFRLTCSNLFRIALILRRIRRKFNDDFLFLVDRVDLGTLVCFFLFPFAKKLRDIELFNKRFKAGWINLRWLKKGRLLQLKQFGFVFSQRFVSIGLRWMDIIAKVCRNFQLLFWRGRPFDGCCWIFNHLVCFSWELRRVNQWRFWESLKRCFRYGRQPGHSFTVP